MLFQKAPELPTAETALPGREAALPTDATHFVLGQALKGPHPEGFETAIFAMGCFWGVERVFWQLPGVWVTSAGYAGGITPNPTYEDHDPTQGMRQGNDQGTQYRSAIYTLNDEQQAEAEASRDAYQAALSAAGRGTITTEIEPAGPYYFAEDYHQGYLAKNPAGYCGIGGTGVVCPIGVGVDA
jgi:peptide-methionine (S)-S-oxide reductase